MTEEKNTEVLPHEGADLFDEGHDDSMQSGRGHECTKGGYQLIEILYVE